MEYEAIRKNCKLSKGKKEKIPNIKHFEHINPWAAGIDVGANSHFVAVPEGCDETAVREFKSFTKELNELADWLKKCVALKRWPWNQQVFIGYQSMNY